MHTPESIKRVQDFEASLQHDPNAKARVGILSDEDFKKYVIDTLEESPAPEPAPMTWQEFVEMATAEGWDMEYPGFVTRILSDEVEVTIYEKGGFEFSKEEFGDVWFPSTSYELAYAAANAVAEAVGGWRC